MKIGYVRVSTKEQNTARQEELMKLLEVDRVYIDKMSGKDMERPFLQEMMNFVREGDSVVVESISRFARNTKDLLELTEQLNSKHVQFVSQKENIDTTVKENAKKQKAPNPKHPGNPGHKEKTKPKDNRYRRE